MQTRILGRTGVQVSLLTLGTMNFGSFGGVEEAEATAIVRHALESGVNMIDTADVYSGGRSEELVGQALRGVNRDDVLIGTKFRLPMDPTGSQWRGGGSRRWIMRAVEDSLKRLGTDRIDLYQMHRPDPDVPIDETLAALTDLQRAGKILYAGSSTFSPSEIVDAQWAAERRALTAFSTEQLPYSILVRGAETDTLPTTLRHGMGVLAWSPLAGGFLSGKYRAGREPVRTRRDEAAAEFLPPWDSDDDRKRTAAERVAALADASGHDIVHLSLAWALNHPAVSTVIIGPRTLDQLRATLPAAELTLSTEELDSIDAIVPPGVTLKAMDTMAVTASLAPGRRRRATA